MKTAAAKTSLYNHNRSTVRISSMLFAALLVVASCGDDDGSSPNINGPACDVVKQTTTASGPYNGMVTYTYKYVVTYAYDQAGNITEQNSSYNYSYSDGKTATSNYTFSNQYSDKGFLQRTLRQYNSVDLDGVTSFTTINEELTYENDRLVRSVSTEVTNGVERKYAVQYEYNAQGRIVKYSNTYNNSTIAIEYNGNTVSKVTYTDGSGNSTSPFLQYNDKGLLVKSIQTSGGYTEEYRYEYTSEGQVAREERWINGKPSSATVYEYDTKENPFNYLNANRKGVPSIPDTRTDFSFKHNYTKSISFSPNADFTGWKTASTAVYIYDYNDKGFPKGYSSRTTDAAGVETSKADVTFAYGNCQ